MARKYEEFVAELYKVILTDVNERKRRQQESFKPATSDVLNVLEVKADVRQNAITHHTDLYEQTQHPPLRLILRRGQAFTIDIDFDRPYNPEKDAILLDFQFGSNPSMELRTKRQIRVHSEPSRYPNRWSARVIDAKQNSVTIETMIGTLCPVGAWQLRVQTGKLDDKQHVAECYQAFAYPDPIYIIFNPWNKGDPVYLEDAILRNEYVLNDHGALWQGAKKSQLWPCPWNFGQFEDVALYAALLALRMPRSPLVDSDYADPVLVIRALTESINSTVMMGRWQDPYDGGKKPWEWTGSVEILEKFVQNPQQHVRYGQCWVFSGLLVTLCRAVGIPCRSVTNLSSAHDTDRTLTIDDRFVKSGRADLFEKVSSESIWNFHVWNEAYTMRRDLPPGYDGWQAIDATPQERSQGRYQCGPMSVEALRRGHVHLNYDGWFIYGEMNADVVSWFYHRDPKAPNGLRLINRRVDMDSVGTCVVTSQPGDPSKPKYVTECYKPVEGSNEERDQIRNAVRLMVGDDHPEVLDLFDTTDGVVEDVAFMFTDLDQVSLGDPIRSVLTIRNRSKQKRSVDVIMDMHVLSYDGCRRAKVVGRQEQLSLVPNQTETIQLQVMENDYSHLIREHGEMSVEVMAHVNETAQIYAKKDIFTIRKPDLWLKASSSRAAVNTPTTITIYFSNPTNQVLTNCAMKLEGAGLNRAREIKIPSRLAGRATMELEYSIVPRRRGQRTLLAIFNSDQLANIRGTCSIRVE